MEEDCVFCKIAEHKLPATIEYEDEDFIAFWDIKPSAPSHLLIVPKKHLLWQENLSAEEKLLGRIFSLAPKVAENVGLRKSGFKLVMNCGRGVGQEIEHFHLHLLGGWPKGGHS